MCSHIFFIFCVFIIRSVEIGSGVFQYCCCLGVITKHFNTNISIWISDIRGTCWFQFNSKSGTWILKEYKMLLTLSVKRYEKRKVKFYCTTLQNLQYDNRGVLYGIKLYVTFLFLFFSRLVVVTAVTAFPWPLVVRVIYNNSTVILMLFHVTYESNEYTDYEQNLQNMNNVALHTRKLGSSVNVYQISRCCWCLQIESILVLKTTISTVLSGLQYIGLQLVIIHVIRDSVCTMYYAHNMKTFIFIAMPFRIKSETC